MVFMIILSRLNLHVILFGRNFLDSHDENLQIIKYLIVFFCVMAMSLEMHFVLLQLALFINIFHIFIAVCVVEPNVFCLNGGTCKVDANTDIARCTCKEPYTGVNCAIRGGRSITI